MAAAPICEHLPWDSEFFGRRIARARPARVDATTRDAILAWCESQRIDCLYLLLEADEPPAAALLGGAGFQLVDVQVTLDRSCDATMTAAIDDIPRGTIRVACAGDGAALRAIARRSHRDSRFYHDGHFPAERCDALYETWIDKSCAGWADRVFVADDDGQPIGYVSCHLRGAGEGQIGLIAVAEAARGRSLSQQLVHAALRWFREAGCTRVSVVTQGRNVRAQRVYQRCGFVTRTQRLWFHKWFTA